MNKINLKYLSLLGLGLIHISIACKKSNTTNNNSSIGNTTTTNDSGLKDKMAGIPNDGNEVQKISDTMYLSALNVYYWNNSLPKYTEFNPRQYYSAGADKFSNMKTVLYKICQVAKNPATGGFYDFKTFPNGSLHPKYSSIHNSNTTSAQGSMMQNVPVLSETPPDSEGSGQGFGFLFGIFVKARGFQPIIINNNTITALRVAVVFPGSEAENIGLKRSDLVTAVNDVEIDSYINYNSTKTEIVGVKSGFTNFIKSAINSNSIKIKIYNTTKQAFITKTLYSKTYISSPVLKYTVLNVNGKKVAYLAFSSFQDLDKTKSDIDKAFANFEQQDINMQDFIFDIRYNGGGYVTTAKYILDKWAGNTQNGNVAFYEYYNNEMQSGAAKTFLKNFKTQDGVTLDKFDFSLVKNTEKFSSSGAGNLKNLKNFYFLVTDGTASSAELTINSMRPYANVTVIGQTTYGKPIGFFPLKIGSYDVYFAMFESKNAKNEGGYFNGITPNYTRIDNPNYDFGNPNESYIRTALDLIAGKTVSQTENRRVTPTSSIYKLNIPTLTINPNYGIMKIKSNELKLAQ